MHQNIAYRMLIKKGEVLDSTTSDSFSIRGMEILPFLPDTVDILCQNRLYQTGKATHKEVNLPRDEGRRSGLGAKMSGEYIQRHENAPLGEYDVSPMSDPIWPIFDCAPKMKCSAECSPSQRSPSIATWKPKASPLCPSMTALIAFGVIVVLANFSGWLNFSGKTPCTRNGCAS